MRLSCLVTLLTIAGMGPSIAATAQERNQDDSYLRAAIPERWTYASEFTQQSPDGDPWWSRLGDPLLDTLIEAGMKNNFDVSAALHRIEEARAQIQGARAGYYPTIGIDASWQRTRMSGATTSHTMPATTTDYFGLGATMSWEIDIFGKVRAGVKQKKASWMASRAEYEGVMVSMAAEIATTYFQLRVAQRQIDVAREHIVSQGHVVAITEARHETGLASALDVAQAKAVYNSTVSIIPSLENSEHTAINALATLLGVYASELPEGVRRHEAVLPEPKVTVETGIPADLLRRRPDLVEAEQNLAAAAAAVGIAKKDFLPTLSLSASASTDAHRAGDLFTRRSIGYSIAPTLSWTVFSGFARKAAVAEARANMESAIDTYNLTVMNAVTETDNAMDSYLRALETIKALRDVVEQSSKALTLSTELYKSGNSGFTNVADAQIQLLEYTNRLITARGDALTSLVNLYRALGGGWNGEMP